MRVSKRQIVDGLSAYIREELLPKLGQDKGLQVLLDVGLHAFKANDRLIDAVFGREWVAAFLQDDGAGYYDVDGLLDNLQASVGRYGELPVKVPPIPLIAPTGCTISLHATDIAAIRDKIGGSQDG